MNKKGIINEVGEMLIGFFMFLLIFGLISVIWYHFYNTGMVGLNNDGIIDDETLDNVSNVGNILTFLDKLVPLVFIFLWGSVIISSFVTSPEHPVIFMLSFISLLVYTLILFLLVDLGSAFFSNSVFSPVLNNLSNTLFFAYNLHLIGFGIGLVSLVWWFRKTTGFNNSQFQSGGFGGIE